MKGFIVAGTNSGCGKTTITMGLMALLQKKGMRVAPFKTGPDYIDPMFHEFVTDSFSYNLDSFMLPHNIVKSLYLAHCKVKDIAVIEGVMGLFDGLGPQGLGSTAELSKVLQLPVILVVSCKAMHQSVAAMVHGFKNFMSNIDIQGVILNQVANKEQYLFLKELIEQTSDIKCVGYVPYNKDFAIESRHLGLLQAEEVSDIQHKIEKLCEIFTETIDIQEITNIATNVEFYSADNEQDIFNNYFVDLSAITLGVAYDKAFRFYYRDNLELLQRCGCKLQYFSPLNDEQIPDNINAMYIGGGYPEVFAHQLSANKKMLQQIKTKAEQGMPIYAECGGLIYLTNSILYNNTEYPMSGVFNCKIMMTNKLQRFGYANVRYNKVDTVCHEFHHSQIVDNEIEANYTLQYLLSKPYKDKSWKCGLQCNNVLAAYAHLHFYSNPLFFKQIAELWKKAII